MFGHRAILIIRSAKEATKAAPDTYTSPINANESDFLNAIAMAKPARLANSRDRDHQPSP